MAQNSQFKVNQLAKDLNLKSKDIVDILAGKGITVKSQATLEPADFNVLFEELTAGNQISGIEDYLDGITVIPSAKKTSGAGSVKVPEQKADSSSEKSDSAVQNSGNSEKTAIKTKVSADESSVAEKGVSEGTAAKKNVAVT